METKSYTLDDVEPTYRPMIIDGEDAQAQSGQTFTRLSPAHEVEVTSFPKGGQEDVDRAVTAARKALDRGWRQSSGSERSKLLLKVADLVRRDAEALAGGLAAATDDLAEGIAAFREKRPAHFTDN
jgi:betaine-aldehyde dehydrogenase